jgi:hypothetical protein
VPSWHNWCYHATWVVSKKARPKNVSRSEATSYHKVAGSSKLGKNIVIHWFISQDSMVMQLFIAKIMTDPVKTVGVVWKGIMCQKVASAVVTICTLRLWWLHMQNNKTVKQQKNTVSPGANIQRWKTETRNYAKSFLLLQTSGSKDMTVMLTDLAGSIYHNIWFWIEKLWLRYSSLQD